MPHCHFCACTAILAAVACYGETSYLTTCVHTWRDFSMLRLYLELRAELQSFAKLTRVGSHGSASRKQGALH